MENDQFELPKSLLTDYRDLCMLRDMMRGHSVKEIALMMGCTTRTASIHIKTMASNMMREAFVNTQGDPEHPANPRWTLEEFSHDPRGCLIAMTDMHIENIEKTYPRIKKDK